MNANAPLHLVSGLDPASRPALSRRMHHAERDGMHLLIEPERPNWLCTNASGIRLLSRFDGRTTIAEAMAAIETDGIPSRGAVPLVRAALDRGILLPDAACDETIPPDPDRSFRLQTCFIKLTNRCNLRCTYCYADSGVGVDLPFEVVIRVLDEIGTRFSGVRFELHGGEPLLHPRVLDIAAAIHDRGHTASLLTNGIAVNARNVGRIAELFDLVQISLDSLTPAVHDACRGREAHRHAIAAIERLRDAGVKTHIAMTVHRGNVAEVPAMLDRYGGLLHLKNIYGEGRAAGFAGALSAAEFDAALQLRFAHGGGAVRRALAARVERSRDRGGFGCVLGTTVVSIDETGNVHPCHLLHRDDTLAGNLRHDSFAACFERVEAWTRAQNLSIRTQEPCRTCGVRKLCAGGCPAVSESETGDFRRAGSYCRHVREDFIRAMFDTEIGADGRSVVDARVAEED